MKLQIKIPKDDGRTIDQIAEHYVLEKQLATQLLESHKVERQHLYTKLYDQLFQQLPHHPQLSRKSDTTASNTEVQRKMNLVKPFLKADTVFLEVGPGDCQFSFEVAKSVQKVYAVDVSQEITKNSNLPSNFELILSNGCDVPAEPNSIAVAYSNQLMEHLHPEDSYEQLKELYRCLQPGGVYICITPNRLAGPHDVSKYFDSVATGFHLKEYTNQELYDLFIQVGFSDVLTYMGGKGVYACFPKSLTFLCERVLAQIPFSVRYRLGNWLPFRAILGVILVAKK